MSGIFQKDVVSHTNSRLTTQQVGGVMSDEGNKQTQLYGQT